MLSLRPHARFAITWLIFIGLLTLSTAGWSQDGSEHAMFEAAMQVGKYIQVDRLDVNKEPRWQPFVNAAQRLHLVSMRQPGSEYIINGSATEIAPGVLLTVSHNLHPKATLEQNAVVNMQQQTIAVRGLDIPPPKTKPRPILPLDHFVKQPFLPGDRIPLQLGLSASDSITEDAIVLIDDPSHDVALIFHPALAQRSQVSAIDFSNVAAGDMLVNVAFPSMSYDEAPIRLAYFGTMLQQLPAALQPTRQAGFGVIPYYTTSAHCYARSSGGAVFNDDLKLVGVIARLGESGQSIVLPTDYVQRLYDIRGLVAMIQAWETVPDAMSIATQFYHHWQQQPIGDLSNYPDFELSAYTARSRLIENLKEAYHDQPEMALPDLTTPRVLAPLMLRFMSQLPATLREQVMPALAKILALPSNLFLSRDVIMQSVQRQIITREAWQRAFASLTVDANPLLATNAAVLAKSLEQGLVLQHDTLQTAAHLDSIYPDQVASGEIVKLLSQMRDLSIAAITPAVKPQPSLSWGGALRLLLGR